MQIFYSVSFWILWKKLLQQYMAVYGTASEHSEYNYGKL